MIHGQERVCIEAVANGYMVTPVRDMAQLVPVGQNEDIVVFNEFPDLIMWLAFHLKTEEAEFLKSLETNTTSADANNQRGCSGLPLESDDHPD